MMPAGRPEGDPGRLACRWWLTYCVLMDDRTGTLGRLIDGLAAHRTHPALLSISGERVSRLDYEELARSVRSLAGGLAAAGAVPGDRVLLLGDSSERWISVCLAAIRLRCTVVPLDVQTGRERLERIIADCSPRFAFCDGAHAEPLSAAGFQGQVWSLDEAADGPQTDAAATAGEFPACEPTDIAILFYTSGTTGPPKGVPLSHANICYQIEAVRETRLLRADDRMLLPLPLHHVYPLVLGVLMPLALGVSIVLPAAVTGPELVRALKAGEATIIIGVPRLYEALLAGIDGRIAAAPAPARLLLNLLGGLSSWLRRHFDLPAGRILLRPLHRALAPRLRALACGGAALDPQVATRLAALGWDVAIGYGLTETSPLLSLKPPGGRHLDTVGRPVDGTELRIAPATVAAGEDEPEAPEASSGDGEILARGPGVFAGYYHLPEKTEEVLTEDGWFHTGDLGHLDSDGRLHIAGRVSSMIVTAGGKNIHPEDLERQYAEHPLIADIGIVAHEGALGAVVMADREQLRERRQTAEAALRRAMAEIAARLPHYQRIRTWLVSETALERTRLGKLRRHLLAKRFSELLSGRDSRPVAAMEVAEMSAADQALLNAGAAASVWQLLARRYPDRALSPDSSTRSDLGIDSLDWLELSLEIARETGVELSEEEIAGIDTVRELLQTIGQSQPTGSGGQAVRSPVADPESFLSTDQRRWLAPLSPAQHWLASRLGVLITGFVRRCWQLEVHGKEHLRAARQFIITPNHVSLLDPFLIGAALDQPQLHATAWGGWTGIAFRNAVLRWGSRLARAVPVDPDRAVVSSLAFAAATLRQGTNLVWFPEGQRSPGGELMSFRPGIGMLLDEVEVAVIPAWIAGAHAALPPGQHWPRRVPVRVYFGAPVTGAELAEEGEGPDRRSRIVNALEQRVRALGRQHGSADAQPG